MTEIKTIGGFFRDPIDPPPPMEALGQLCAQYDVHFIDLRDGERGAASVDLIMAFGGDGTVLRALERFPDVPVLAVNYGNIGFLTPVSYTHLTLPTICSV